MNMSSLHCRPSALLILLLISSLISRPSSALRLNDQVDPAFTQEADSASRRYEDLHREGRYDQAAAAARERVTTLTTIHGRHSAEVANALTDLDEAYNELALADSARTVLTEALAIHEELGGRRQAAVVHIMNHLAWAEDGAKRLDEAAAWSLEALAIAREVPGENSLLFAVAQLRLSSARMNQGEFTEAIQLGEAARDLIAATADVPSRQSIDAQILLSWCYNGMGRTKMV